MAAQAAKLAPGARLLSTRSTAMLALGLDGVVIATPSALHAEQSIPALEAGVAVFCQKPLGRNAGEARAVVDGGARGRPAARRSTSPIASPRACGASRELVRGGRARAACFAADLVFHNAYGPDKPWFYDRALSGGGCVIDLGVHLVDLALWALGLPGGGGASAPLLARRRSRCHATARQVEDYAVATLRRSPDGTIVRLACSWRLHAGREAVIGAAFYGTEGGAALRNVGGSFYDFTAEQYRGTRSEPLAMPPDDWGGRAAADWAMRLGRGERFDPAAERLVTVADMLDRIYAAA